MNLGRGFSIPPEKEILKNGGICIPPTPDKSVVSTSYVPVEKQQNLMVAENWNDLLGMYTGLLQDETSDELLRKLNPCDSVGLHHGEQSRDAVRIETCNGLPQNFNLNSCIGLNCEEKKVQDVTYVQTSNRLPHSFNLTGGLVGLNQGESDNRVIAPVEKFRILNQNAGSISFYRQNLGGIVPQKVGSLTELMGMNKLPCGVIANEMPKRSTSVIGSHTIIDPHTQVESNWKMYASARPILQQNQFLHENQDLGGCNLQEVPNNRLSAPYWADCNLNLPQRLKARPSSSIGESFQFDPATPDQKKQLKNYQLNKVPMLSADKISTQGKEQQDNIIFSQQHEIIERNHNELDHTLGTSSTTILTSANDNIHSGGGNGRIDLNKTPQQKPPKRRKHRPKVVVEMQLNKTPKSPAPRKNTPDKNPTGKRKYVRKTSIQTITSPLTDVVNEVEASKLGSAVKSCRRGLNFDLENEENIRKGSKVCNQSQSNEGSRVPFNLNLGSDNSESTELNKASTSSVKIRNMTENLCNSVHSVNHIPPEELLQLATTLAPPTSIDHTLNIIARNMKARNANINQNGGQNKYSQVHQLMGGDLAQLVTEANTIKPNLDRIRQPILQTRTQFLQDLEDVAENRGAKRDYSHIELRSPQTVTVMSSQVWSLGASKTGHANSGSNTPQQNVSETSKRKKIEEIFHATSSSTCSWITADEDCSGQMEGRWNKSFHAQSSALCLNNGLPSSDLKGKNTSRNLNNEAKMVTCHWYMNSKDSEHKLQQQSISSQINSCAEQMAQKKSHHLAQAQITNSLTAGTNSNLESVSQRDIITQGNGIKNYPSCESVKSQTAGQTSGQISSINNTVQQEIRHSKGRGRPSKKVTGPQEQRINLISVDYITDRLKDLDINNNGKEIVGEEQSALVPYKGDGAIATYEAFDQIKKRPPRPKVDLDPETNRLWNFLMGKQGSESEETVGDDRQKWWEEERKVLRNRADSFIARMHLVQGDRRFSKWKGSVVDSVIGVFLTQNVSDHLSSSAFMSLAAKFPLKSTITQPCCQNGGGPSVEQHKVCVTYPDGTTSYDYKMTRESVYHTSPVTSSESLEYGAENVMTGRRTILINDHAKRAEEDMISSQSSSESFVLQAFEDIKSSSGSNSEAEDQITGWNFSKNHGLLSFTEQVERIAALKYQVQVKGCSFPEQIPILGHQRLELPVHGHGQNPGMTYGRNACAYSFPSNVPHHSSSSNISTGLEKWEADILALSGKGSISSLVSTDIELPNGTGREHAHDMSGQSAESSFTAQQTGRPKFSPSTANHAILQEHFEQKTNLWIGSQSGKGQHIINYSEGERQETLQQESIFLTDTMRPSEDANNLKCPDSITPELTEMGQIDSSGGPSSKMGTTTSHASKQKAAKEKTESFNWDTLRKKVQSETGKRKRSRDTMDSIDYDAIRNADVREISDAIKERGMNNMLAERIKDFLNRIVREHEKVDLEWLRDVQPDKVKDYLLSIRGLGLKSVECVRLLTLHNVAFPVDTNVGRIAVRLGWVPLRPLPESLQLHLLELYPVLESIQKYLWPRLCHLDQETLYELHYQMITFGKVFCTKRDPNCNACPMRGDCRHFASAYASARLSLPGPDERRVVCSDTPTSANNSSNMIKNLMPLPPSEDNLEKGMGLTRNCEPIIEEPTTPEPLIEVPEKDIEDAFYEDPNEIPVIKLNIEAFTTNLQSFMQEQQEMQGDMSNALVALSPEFASIPMPKLKHVSRLRTEHQVYELPDSHPLLKELDKREPDDPSPYLLAIWTPGETSDSVQPPEIKCNSQELSGLCEKETCFSCSSTREAQAQTVRGTILIPCRTAMRGSFPLNGTYFQVNEVFADHESSMNPIDVPRSLLWNLSRRTVFFGTSVTTIFKGLTTEGIQYCFWKGFVCVRGFDQKTRAPRPLSSRLHHPASKMVKQNEQR